MNKKYSECKCKKENRVILKSYSLMLIIIFLCFGFSFRGEKEFCGSKKSYKYHFSNCIYVSKIKPSNLVRFKNPKEAISKGYIPCRICKPPVK